VTGPGTHTTDVLVLGGGMAGVSVAAELAADRRVTVLDQEPTFAFHTTGRSAAMFLETYGGPVIRALTVASRTLFDELGLLTPLPSLNVALLGHGDAVRALHAATHELVPDVELLSAEEAAACQPLLRPERIELALLEPSGQEIDVHGLHQHYLRTLRAHGGRTQVSAGAVSAGYGHGVWTVVDAAGARWQAPVVVDAAGAWADDVAALFGGVRVGLRALRRTAFLIDTPPRTGGPMFGDVPDTFYVKPDAGRLLCSPADETPHSPADARPDELEIARAIAAINHVTTLEVRHVRAAWAGLRSFVADRTPVVGFDPRAEGLFWLAGQGGYGIQTAPALARTAAAILRDGGVPVDVAGFGVDARDLAADRVALRNPDA
jgi:D-arginine dehydrogenase